MSQKLKIDDLIPHEKNDYFFDDIKGDAWTEFVESIRTSGVIEPIVVTQNKVIVSGHQRVKACKLLREIGDTDREYSEIDAEVRIFDSEDEVLKCLIETNIRQRGVGNPNPVKFGRCIKELERLYGIQHGATSFQGNQFEEVTPNNLDSPKTQEQLALELGLSTETLRNYKILADAIPEIQDLLETGIVTPTTARAIVKSLPEFQQEEVAKQFINADAKATKRAVDKAVAEIKQKLMDDKEKAISEIEQRIKDRDDEIANLKDALEKSKTSSGEKGGSSTREKFEKQRADRLKVDKDKLEEQLKELKDALAEEKAKDRSVQSDSETKKELDYLKQQTLTNAKMELADFVKKYSDVLDVGELLQNALRSL